MVVKCNHPDCNKHANFNNLGEKRRKFCAKHKEEGMVDVTHAKCNHPDCNKRAHFNNLGEKRGKFCAKHKEEGMVDVTNIKCNHPDCNKQANFNNLGEKRGKFCAEHKEKGMVDITHTKCKSDWCDTLVTKKYEGYCLYCFVNMFPEKPITRNYKTKEYAVVEFIKSKFPNLDIVSDKKILNGCSKRRPDIFVDLVYQVVIIEIDENQHINYDCSCENKRLMELSRDVGHCPIVFIRFNPDNYTQNKKKITSCWGVDGNGFACVKKNKKKEWIQRLDLLKTTFESWIDGTNITDKTIETIKLYYDK
jgi:hypothetical protein